MGQLRDRMEQDLKLKGLSPATIRNYLLYCRKFAGFFMRSPQELVPLGTHQTVSGPGHRRELRETHAIRRRADNLVSGNVGDATGRVRRSPFVSRTYCSHRSAEWNPPAYPGRTGYHSAHDVVSPLSKTGPVGYAESVGASCHSSAWPIRYCR